MKLREEADRCIRLARQTIDNSVAAALFAYACELEQRAQLLEQSSTSDSAPGMPGRPAPLSADSP
jgi:hypothetical protein